MTNILGYAQIILSILLIFIVFISPSKGGMGSLMGGSDGNKEGKKFDFLTKLTFCIVIVFMITSASVVYVKTIDNNESVVINQLKEGN